MPETLTQPEVAISAKEARLDKRINDITNLEGYIEEDERDPEQNSTHLLRSALVNNVVGILDDHRANHKKGDVIGEKIRGFEEHHLDLLRKIAIEQARSEGVKINVHTDA